MAKNTTFVDLNTILPEEVKASFKVEGLNKQNSHKIVFHLYGEIDFSKISLAKAKSLVERKFPYLKAKDAK